MLAIADPTALTIAKLLIKEIVSPHDVLQWRIFPVELLTEFFVYWNQEGEYYCLSSIAQKISWAI